MQGELLKEVDTCRIAASPLHPFKTFTEKGIGTHGRKHKQSASFFRVAK